MLRRSLPRAAPIAAPSNPSVWSAAGAELVKGMTIGKCTDTTVMDKSIIPTRHLQRSLFRLPIPKLEDTTKRYLAAIKPLVTPTAFEKTSQITQSFQSGEGAKLQMELVKTDKANPHTSYISADWFDLYLQDRQPLPINYNANLIARNDPDKTDGLTRATFWISSTVRFYKRYLENTLKPEVFYFGSKSHYCRQPWFQKTVALTPRSWSAKVMAIGSNFHAFPLDMSQNDNLFNSTRIPGAVQDELRAVGFHPHIVVAYRGHYFSVNVADKDCNPLPDEQIYARLRDIVHANPTAAKADAGIFTSMPRTEWCSVRNSLLRDATNKKNLETIDTAMFVLNLDLDDETHFTSCSEATKASRHFLVKDSNRWWDKSFSVAVSRNGTIGVSFEHAWGDGVAVLRYTQDCFNDSVNRSSQALNKNARSTESLLQLSWKFTPEIESIAEQAKSRLSREIKSMDFFVGLIDNVGSKKSSIFAKGLAKPDPFMQVAMQLAWWRLNKSTVSTYESASTAAFLRGRTECIRSATIEAQAFALLMDKPQATAEERVKALLDATNKHAAISKEAKMGQGIDRHLFALRKVSERINASHVPEIFRDPSYKTLGSNMISTSSLYSDCLMGGGFGPVSPGYGVGYAAAETMMLFNISAWKESRGPMHSCEDFFKALYESVADMHNLLEATAPAK